MTALETALLVVAVIAIVIAFIQQLMLAEARDQVEDAQDAAATAIQDAERRIAAATAPREAPRG